jgi:hypothetical protein
VTTAIVERLPIPRFDEVTDAPEIARIAAALGNVRRKADATAFHDVRLKADATLVASGFSRTSSLARLNALAAHVYQLTEAEFRHVLGTFPLVPLEEREAALGEFQNRRV